MFTTESGVRQGYPLSLFLFNFVNEGQLQVLLNKLSECVAMFGMRFEPSKCNMLLQDWVGLTPTLTLADEPL